MKGIAPYTRNPTERTNVGDGLRTSRGIKENAVCIRRGVPDSPGDGSLDQPAG